LKNVQILKVVRIVRKKNNEKRKGNKNQKKTIKPEKKKKHAKKTHPAALTGRPSVAPTRAELSSAPLTGRA
jgi:hypothetical protein